MFAVLTRKGPSKIICRFGFKYIEFSERLKIVDNYLLYGKCELCFWGTEPDKKLFIKFEDVDIIKESMMSIRLRQFELIEQSKNDLLYFPSIYQINNRHFKKFKRNYEFKIIDAYHQIKKKSVIHCDPKDIFSHKKSSIWPNFDIITNLDIIELSRIHKINWDNNIPVSYLVWDITKRKNIFIKGDTNTLKDILQLDLNEDKYYFMAILVINHKINKINKRIVLTITINNSVFYSDGTLLLIRFNKKSLKNYLKLEMINKLSI